MSNIYFPHILLYNKNDKKEKLNKKGKIREERVKPSSLAIIRIQLLVIITAETGES